jgi:hypothetical protein
MKRMSGSPNPVWRRGIPGLRLRWEKSLFFCEAQWGSFSNWSNFMALKRLF